MTTFAIALTTGKVMTFEDERDLDQLGEALASTGRIKITGRTTAGERVMNQKAIIFRESVVSISQPM